LRVLYLTLAIVVSDQITKLLVKGFSLPFIDFYHQGMQLGQSIPVIGDFLRITFIENPGMAFGIEIGGRLFLAIFTFIASIGIFLYLYKVRNESLVVRLTLAVILGGAIGNLIDRCFYGVIFGYAPLFYGKVVDFIDMDFFKIDFLGFYMDRFAVFNIADASVSTGIALILLFYKKFTDLDKSAAAVKEEAAQYTAGEEKSDV
jgi:signal peptidase II